MPRLPRISGADVIRILERAGYAAVRTRGSHVRLYPPADSAAARKVTVPLHKELKMGTLLAIMKDACLTIDDIR